jgi:hypothetical protein
VQEEKRKRRLTTSTPNGDVSMSIYIYMCSSKPLFIVDKRKERKKKELVLLLRSSCWYTRKTSNIRKHILSRSILYIVCCYIEMSTTMTTRYWRGRRKKRLQQKKNERKKERHEACESELNLYEYEWPFTFETDMLIVPKVLMSNMWHLWFFFRNQQITIIIIKTIIIIIIITIQHRLQQRRLHLRHVYRQQKCVVIPMNHILANIDLARLIINFFFK